MECSAAHCVASYKSFGIHLCVRTGATARSRAKRGRIRQQCDVTKCRPPLLTLRPPPPSPFACLAADHLQMTCTVRPIKSMMTVDEFPIDLSSRFGVNHATSSTTTTTMLLYRLSIGADKLVRSACHAANFTPHIRRRRIIILMRH